MDILDSIKHPIIFVGGKGGVGKTTSAASLAVRFAERAEKTLIISTDPAHSLGDALDLPLSNNPTSVSHFLDAVELDPNTIVDEHFAQVMSTLRSYTSPEMLPKMRDFLNLSRNAPGAQEAAILEAISNYVVGSIDDYDHIIFDTAPSGHTLRLLSLPEMMQSWTESLLSAQRRQARLRAAANAMSHTSKHPPTPADSTNDTIHNDEVDLAHRTPLDNNSEVRDARREVDGPGARLFGGPSPDRWEAAVTSLEARRALFASTRDILHDSNRTAIILVLIPEQLPLLETERTVKQLRDANLPCFGLFLNQVLPTPQKDPFWQRRAEIQQSVLEQIYDTFRELPILKIHLQDRDIRGPRALNEFFS